MSGYSQIRGDLVWYRLAKAGLDAHARDLFFFLLAPPGERPYAGLRRYLPNEPLSFMPDLSPEAAQEALSALQAADLVRYDPEASIVFVPLLLESQPCKGPNAVTGAAGVIEGYPDSPVLAPALAHLAQAAREAGQAARARAGELKDAKKRETATRSAEQMEALAKGLEERRARVSQDELPLQAPSKGVRSPSEGGSKGVRRGSEAPSEGLAAAAQNETRSPFEGGSKAQNEAGSPFEGVPKGVNKPLRRGSEGASEGLLTRAGACAPQPKPEPKPKEEPPQSPPARGGPPKRVGGILGRFGGKGG